MDAREAAAKAADLIDTVGWTRGAAGRPGECACAGAAIAEVICGDRQAMYCGTPSDGPDYDPATSAALDKFAKFLDPVDYAYAGSLFAYGGGRVADWNDTAGRTQDEVTAKLREFASSELPA